MKINKKENGFTIIEVVLVLAIAGLIFLMVFIALPALQRSQRDTQRKNDLSRFNTAVASFASNNRGDLPAADAWGSCDESTDPPTCSGFLTDYVTVNGDTFVDPSGTPYVVNDTGATTIPAWDDTTPTVYVSRNSVCNGEGVTGGQGARKIAFRMKLEGSGTACQSN